MMMYKCSMGHWSCASIPDAALAAVETRCALLWASRQEGLARSSKTSLEFVSVRGMKMCLDSVIPNSEASLLILSFHQRVLG